MRAEAAAPPILDPDLTLQVPLGRFRLPLFLGLVLATTAFGGWIMWSIMGFGGIRPLEAFILACFLPTFGWITMAFWSGVLGCVLGLLEVDPITLRRRRHGVDGGPDQTAMGAPGGLVPLAMEALPPGLTALVMPAHNEDPQQVISGIRATLASLEAADVGHLFHFFLLSDTPDPEAGAREEAAWTRFRESVPDPERLHYRRRSSNEGRKPGNIADFLRRWGGDYRYMVVLDADSVMEASTLLELVRTMEANPEAGIVQTVPVPRGQVTRFGRFLQFAGRLYGPMMATGYSFWHGDSANYWGHNAILRVEPFAAHGTLPRLPGRPPLGGEVLSHDFVEAALLRRAGWKCYLLPHLKGSWEEVPGNLVDYALRDRRWCQGSLQHLRLLTLPDLRFTNRLHFLMGAMGYLSSALWFLLLLGSTAYVLLPSPEGPAGGARLAEGPRAVGGGFHPPLVSLLLITAIILFLPRGLAYGLALLREREAFGGGPRLTGRFLAETGFTVLMAPILMLLHTRFVGEILLGGNVMWQAQARGPRELTADEAWDSGWSATLVGMGWASVTLWFAPLFTLWLAPILLGLLLAIPIFRWSSRRSPEPSAGLQPTASPPPKAPAAKPAPPRLEAHEHEA